MSQIRSSRSSPALPLHLAVTRPAGGTGLTVLLELRDGSTLNSYLDFFDQTFKTAGWLSRTVTMTELGNGHYGYTLNVSSLTNIPTLTEHLVAEYRSFGITPAFAAQDLISLPLNVDAGVDEIRFQQEALAMVSGDIAASGNQYAYKSRTGANTLFVLEDNDPTSRDRLAP